MKPLAALLAALTLTAAPFPAQTSAPSSAGGPAREQAPLRYARAAKGGVALRNLGDQNAHQVMELENGTLLAVFEERAGWYAAEVPGGVPVWIFGQYLAPAATSGVYRVQGDGVNVRPRAESGHANYPLGQLYDGDLVTAIARKDEALPLAEDWVQVWSPAGIRAWIRAADTKPIEEGGDAPALWKAALAELAKSPDPRSEASAQSKPAERAVPAKPAEPTPDERAAALLVEADELMEAERNKSLPDCAAMRDAYVAVMSAAPKSAAARRAREQLEIVESFEKVLSLRTELEEQKRKAQEDLLARQEAAWDLSRAKDPLGQRFAGRGQIVRREVGGAAPRYFLRHKDQDVFELLCSSGRYDLDVFSGYTVGVTGESLRVQAVEAASAAEPRTAVFDVERLRVLARR